MDEPRTVEPKIRILVVDDEPAVVAVLEALLSAAGHDVVTAHGGEECLRVTRKTRPDIILLDLRMPGMDGFATAKALAAAEETRLIPIIMVTGQADEQDRVRALRAGAVDILVKPAAPEELIAKVRSLARMKAYHDDQRDRTEELTAGVAGTRGQLRDALDAFARFVPHELLRFLSRKSVVDVALGDQVLTDMAILFSDIRSFTTLSETMSPQETFKFLNSYLERMNPFIWEHEGFVDKYIGDGIMALFPRGPASALNTAIAMLTHIPVYNGQRASFGYAPIRIGIGIHTGSVMLGIIGHDRFLQGTVISDAVNLASRLEGLTKTYGVSLVVSSDVLFGLPDPNRYAYRFLDRVTVKGKQRLVSVYEVFDGDHATLVAQKSHTREVFEKGVFAYHAGDFAAARRLFDGVGPLEHPDPPFDIYRRRCERSLKLGTVEDAVVEP